jgi:O-antigen/teichoic acid export membrane protein
MSERIAELMKEKKGLYANVDFYSASWYRRSIVELIKRFQRSAKARATFFYGGSSLVCQTLRVAGLLFSTRLISAEQFGLYATAGMIMGFAGLLKEFGQNSAYLSFHQEDRGHTSFHLLLSTVGSVAAAAVMLVVVVASPSFSSLHSVVALMMLTLVLEAALQTPQLIANKRFDFHRTAVIEISSVLTWLVCILFGSLFAPNVLALVGARFAETAVRGAFLFAWYRHDFSRFSITGEAVRYFLRFAKILGPLGWVQSFLANLDVALLKAFATDVELGVYDRTQQLMRVPLSLSVSFIDSVAGSSYSREQRLRGQTRKSLFLFMAVVSLGLVAGLILIEVFLLFFAKSVLGFQWQSAVSDLWVWAIPLAILRPYVWNFNILFTSSGRPIHFLVSSVSLTLSFLVFGLLLTPALHAKGVYAAQGIAYFIVLVGLMGWFLGEFQRDGREAAGIEREN